MHVLFLFVISQSLSFAFLPAYIRPIFSINTESGPAIIAPPTGT